jgi:opacity protein-like surface antigen
MNAFLRKSLGISLCLFASSNESFSQTELGKYEVGFTGGIFIYQGDLTPSPLGSYRTPGWNLNLFVNRTMSTKLTFRAQLAGGTIRGNDAAYSHPAWRQQRNFNFHSLVVELSFLALYKVYERNRLTGYVFGGGGLAKLNIIRDWTNFNGEYFATEPELQQKLATDAVRTPPKLIPVVPIGAGAEYALSERISLLAETNYRLTKTDYIDGFSQSANPSRLDHYQSHSVGVKYRFGKRSGVDCPTVIY